MVEEKIKEEKKEYKSVKIKGEEIKLLYDFPLKRNDFNIKFKSRDLIDKISLMSDKAFRKFINSPAMKKYIAYIISQFIDVSEEYLRENLKISSNEVPKKNINSVDQRSDFVCEVDDTAINIEVNNNVSIEYLHRNMDYMFSRYSSEVKKSSDYYKYRQSIVINLNNFAFEGVDDIYTISYLRDSNGIVLTDKIIYINFFIPNLIEKCYNLGIDKLEDIEKFIYAMVEDSIKKLEEIMKEMPIVKELVEDLVEFSKDGELVADYDYDKAYGDQRFNDGKEEGKDEKKNKNS